MALSRGGNEADVSRTYYSDTIVSLSLAVCLSHGGLACVQQRFRTDTFSRILWTPISSTKDERNKWEQHPPTPKSKKKSCKNVCWSSLISAQVRTRHIYELWNWSDAGCSHSLFGLHLEGPPGHFPSPFLQLFGIESFRSFLFLVRSGSVSRVTTTPLVYIFPPNITWSYYLTTFFGGDVMGSVFGIAVFSFGDFIVSSAYFFFADDSAKRWRTGHFYDSFPSNNHKK